MEILGDLCFGKKSLKAKGLENPGLFAYHIFG
jgi:hypothetical protein